MILPGNLQQAIETELHNKSLRDVSKIVEEVSNRYRVGLEGQDRAFVQSEEDALAYVAYRLPATYGAVSSTLTEVRARRVEWQPKSLLDVGSGPGTSMWAAVEVWPQLENITLLEREENMIKIGKRLAKHARATPLRNAVWKKVDLTKPWQVEPHDLVIASHVLGELPPSELENIINRLWSVTSADGTLIIIEPAKSSRGFNLILRAREQLITRGANIIAPCPHADSCPMSGGERWCHFSQRVERSRFHRIVKKGFRPYEDVKFSYLAVSRQKGSGIKGRLTLQPQMRPGHINLELCAPDGLYQITVPKREKAMFKQVRKLNWGAALAEDATEADGADNE